MNKKNMYNIQLTFLNLTKFSFSKTVIQYYKETVISVIYFLCYACIRQRRHMRVWRLLNKIFDV